MIKSQIGCALDNITFCVYSGPLGQCPNKYALHCNLPYIPVLSLYFFYYATLESRKVEKNLRKAGKGIFILREAGNRPPFPSPLYTLWKINYSLSIFKDAPVVAIFIDAKGWEGFTWEVPSPKTWKWSEITFFDPVTLTFDLWSCPSNLT